MKKQKERTSGKKIADEILHQIGGSVIFVLLLIAAVSVSMAGWLSITSKKTELVQESNAAANQITGFLEQYTKSAEQLAVNPEIRQVMIQTKPGDDIWQSEKMDTVMYKLTGIGGTDSENVLAICISGLDHGCMDFRPGCKHSDTV